MANQLSVTIGVPVLFDGTSTTFSFDLAKDPYAITSGAPNGQTEGNATKIVNYFTDTPLGRQPSGVISSGSLNGVNFTASLSGTVITVTFASAPPAGGAELQLFLLF